MNYLNAKTSKLAPALLSLAITLIITVGIVIGMAGSDFLSVPSLAASTISAQLA